MPPEAGGPPSSTLQGGASTRRNAPARRRRHARGARDHDARLRASRARTLGAPLADALRMATSTPARLLRLDGRIGASRRGFAPTSCISPTISASPASGSAAHEKVTPSDRIGLGRAPRAACVRAGIMRNIRQRGAPPVDFRTRRRSKNATNGFREEFPWRRRFRSSCRSLFGPQGRGGARRAQRRIAFHHRGARGYADPDRHDRSPDRRLCGGGAKRSDGRQARGRSDQRLGGRSRPPDRIARRGFGQRRRHRRAESAQVDRARSGDLPHRRRELGCRSSDRAGQQREEGSPYRFGRPHQLDHRRRLQVERLSRLQHHQHGGEFGLQPAVQAIRQEMAFHHARLRLRSYAAEGGRRRSGQTRRHGDRQRARALSAPRISPPTSSRRRPRARTSSWCCRKAPTW